MDEGADELTQYTFIWLAAAAPAMAATASVLLRNILMV